VNTSPNDIMMQGARVGLIDLILPRQPLTNRVVLARVCMELFVCAVLVALTYYLALSNPNATYLSPLHALQVALTAPVFILLARPMFGATRVIVLLPKLSPFRNAFFLGVLPALVMWTALFVPGLLIAKFDDTFVNLMPLKGNTIVWFVVLMTWISSAQSARKQLNAAITS
jgi:hypothetical protein